MTRQTNDTWTVKGSLSLGTQGYKFLLDGKKWVFDPRNSERKLVNEIDNSAIEITEAPTKGIVTATTPSNSCTITIAARH